MAYFLHAAQQRVWNIALKLSMIWERGDHYTRRVNALHHRLGVPREYRQRGLPFFHEALELVAVPCGLEGGLRRMTPETRAYFLGMQDAAAADGVTLLVRWAYRSADDQAQLIRDQRGEIKQLLTWIAAPGYSEHHTGRALDFECFPADAQFEDTAAFKWLVDHANKYGFRMSYPRNNVYGFVYEPWHWCFCP